ncbi:ABC transporter permease [Candidatus Bathyarchaeota archaeon]|nr:ABC transporter permease [Candidatus Bathyarchaeota archaeon]MBS7636542.1 ABC transporter permease [Candidatus Bathyarchaeota archaeon]
MGKTIAKSSIFLNFACVLISAFILIPVVIIFLTSLDPAKYIRFPPSGFSLLWYEYFFSNKVWQNGLLNSVYVAVLNTIISVPCGILAAYAYRKYTFKLKNIFNTIMIIPYVTPSLLVGIALLMAFGRTILRGTYFIVAIAHALWSTSFIYILMQAALSNYDFTYEEAAKDLGANLFQMFSEVTLPLLKSAFIAAILFAFISSFGEVTMAIFLVTSKTVTLPVLLWTSLKYELHPVATVASVICIIFAIVIFMLITKFFGTGMLSKIGM